MRDLGFNYRITDFQCALGISQLKRLDSFIDRRKEIAKNYDRAFLDSIVKPLYTYHGKSSYHLYVVQVDFDNLNISKEEFFLKMRERGIGLQLHYIPINKQPHYIKLGYGEENTPNMDRYYKECFSLPIYPSLSDGEQEYIIDVVIYMLQALTPGGVVG
jgi:dTDP-4-amino-4,6-dideoxygalactose transaminase